MQLLCPSADLIEGQSLSLRAQNMALFAVRKAGVAYVYRNRCPHRGVPLNWQPNGFLDESAAVIRCASHGALFNVHDGECISGPCQGQELERIDCREDAQGVWGDV